MPERWIGVTVSSDKITIVDAVVGDSGPITIEADFTLSLQKGAKPRAYSVMHNQMHDYVTENKIDRVVVKGSAVSLGGTKLPHLHAAELRGVVMGAVAPICEVSVDTKGHLSKTFGNRKVDEYVADSAFWAKETNGRSLRIGSREAALLILAVREQ